MARYTGPVCKLCRREGVKLFLKGDRCYSKCPIDKEGAAVPPGQHARRRAGKPTEYGKRLREKQKARRISGVLERQFRRMFAVAAHQKGNTGENLLRLLETRLDNVVRRLGFSTSPRASRQLVFHGNIRVNGKTVDIPSYQVQPGDVVSLAEAQTGNLFIKRSLHAASQRGLPAWLEWDGSIARAVKGSVDAINFDGVTIAGTMKAWPSRAEMSYPVNEQFIVELFSK